MRASLNQDPNSTFRYQSFDWMIHLNAVSQKEKLLYLDFNPIQSSVLETKLRINVKTPIQVHIVQSTGRMTYVQLFSMIFSLFTLTINASRAFFIQRGKDEADPAPNLHMILKVFPHMLIQVKGISKAKFESLKPTAA